MTLCPALRLKDIKLVKSSFINILCSIAQPLGYAMLFIDFDKNFKLTVYLSIKKTHRHISLCIMAKKYSISNLATCACMVYFCSKSQSIDLFELSAAVLALLKYSASFF